MKRSFTLFISLFTAISLFAQDPFENAFWVIKDGKINTGVSFLKYDEPQTGNVLEETVVDGEQAVVYQHLYQYLDARIAFDSLNPVDLNQNYILYLEYKIPDEHRGSRLVNGNKPLFIFGFNETMDGLRVKDANTSDAYVMVDAKWGETNKWVKTYKYIQAHPSITSITGMIFSYGRELLTGSMTEFPYVKNLAIVPAKDNVKPFYYENFDGASMGEWWYETVELIGTKSQCTFTGGVNAVVTAKDIEYMDNEGMSPLSAFRDFCKPEDKDQDGSGYIDCEILHALQVEPLRDSIVFPGIAIPAGCQKFFTQMIIKKHKNTDGYWVDADYSEVENVDMPIKLKFNTGQIVDIADDRMNLIWTKYTGEIDVPEGATSVDLIFGSMSVGYIVDNIIFSAAEFDGVKNILSENNAFEINAYVDNNGNIVVLNGELQAVYNLNGALATDKDKVVVIVVKNAEGKLSSKLMVK